MNLTTPPASAGAVFVEASGAGLYLQNCTFSNNIARQYGGAFATSLLNGEVVLSNCLFTDNTAQAGGACYFFVNPTQGGAKTTIVNCTIAFNEAVAAAPAQIYGGAGLYVEDSIGPGFQIVVDVRNSIINLNRNMLRGIPRPANQNVYGPGAASAVPLGNSIIADYSDIAAVDPLAPTNPPIWFGAGMTAVDPSFTNGPARNLRLLPSSLCIDAGSDLRIAAEAFDLNGNGVLDLFIPFDLDLTVREENSGAGNGGVPGGALPGIVDMGCYETPPATL